MSLTITAWRLRDPKGRSSRCLVAERDRRWRITVWQGDRISLCETYMSDDAALARADALWALLLQHGWRDEAEEQAADCFTRQCPACYRPTGKVLVRVFHEVTFVCSACQYGWTAEGRVSAHDRRRAPRAEPDRRSAA
jgi:hypothetical protein